MLFPIQPKLHWTPQSARYASKLRLPPYTLSRDTTHHLDTDATWGKSAYHGWVYGYGVHLSNNRAGFPKLVQIETASVSESAVLQAKEPHLVHTLAPHTLTTDDAYTQARRIRRWAQAGVVLLTPARRWVKGRYAMAYHRFIGEPQQAELLRSRRTAIEPVFDLLARLGTERGVRIARGQCVEHYGEGEAYLPLLYMRRQILHHFSWVSIRKVWVYLPSTEYGTKNDAKLAAVCIGGAGAAVPWAAGRGRAGGVAPLCPAVADANARRAERGRAGASAAPGAGGDGRPDAA